MLKILSSALLLLSFNALYAQENNVSLTNLSLEGLNSYLNKFTLEAVLASEQVKDSEKHEVNGLYTSFKTSLLYALTENDELRMYASYVKESYEEYDSKNYFELGEIMYRRKAMLNPIDHGVNLDFELKHGIVLDTDTRRLWGFTSETIPQLIIKKKLPNAMGVELKARHHFYHRNRNKASTVAHEDRLYASVHKMFAGSFLFNTELKYRHKIYTGRHYSYHRGGIQNKNHEDLVIHPGLMYFANRQTMLEGYIESKLNDTFDKRKFKDLVRDELILGAALYVTVF